MPFIKVQSSISTPQKAEVEGMLKTLSSKLASHTGKPESYVVNNPHQIIDYGVGLQETVLAQN